MTGCKVFTPFIEIPFSLLNRYFLKNSRLFSCTFGWFRYVSICKKTSNQLLFVLGINKETPLNASHVNPVSAYGLRFDASVTSLLRNSESINMYNPLQISIFFMSKGYEKNCNSKLENNLMPDQEFFIRLQIRQFV